MNKVIVGGNLTKDATIKQKDDAYVITFTIAVSRKDREGNDLPAYFFNCYRWMQNPGKLPDYLVKGQAVTVSGALTSSMYEKDGQKLTSYSIAVDSMDLGGGPMNVAVVSGNLAREATVREIKTSDTKIVDFTIAADKKNGAEYIRCERWMKNPGRFPDSLAKGRNVSVKGQLVPGEYEKDGVKRYTMTLRVDMDGFSYGPKRRDAAEAAPAAQQPAKVAPAPQPAAPSLDDFMSIPDGGEDELPWNL